MSAPKPKFQSAAKAPPGEQQHKTSATQKPPQQQKQQHAPAAPGGQLPLRSAMPTSGAPKPPPATTKNSPCRPNTSVNKASVTQNLPQQQKQQQQAPTAPGGQLPLRSATPTGDATQPPPPGPAATNTSPGRLKSPVKVPHTTWTPVSELNWIIPRGLKPAPAVPPPPPGTPIQWKYLKDPVN
ncbi:hypothetical protein F5144DRAFT_559683 [Chaetomium tenue]|uniref:Uncharacterized protein n=1 Tax=Chaetomium tenue TaxID=1854479 RepID=A0ACB7PE60_9PEZI|nr:hypothetical protein F5144DRAFT_559683 [Chaetomium globosum]